MKVFQTAFVAVASALLLSAQPAFAAKAPPEPVTVTQPAALKGVNQVMVSGFTIIFLTERKDTAQAGGGLLGNGFGGRSTARSSLEGVSPAQFQAITESAWSDFKAKLTAAGYTLADRTPVVTPKKGGVVFKTMPSGTENNVYFGEDAKSTGAFYAPAELGGVSYLASDKLVPGGLTNMKMMMAMATNEYALTQTAKDTGIPVLQVIYLVDFADSNKYGGFARSWSNVTVKAGLAIVPGASKITVVPPAGKISTVQLGQPVAISGDFGDMVDTMSGADKAAQVATRVISLAGGLGSNSVKKLALRVDGEGYARGVGEAASETNQRLLAKLAASR